MKIVTIISLVIFIWGCNSHNDSIEKLGNKIDLNKVIVDSSFWLVEKYIINGDTIFFNENPVTTENDTIYCYNFGNNYLLKFSIYPDAVSFSSSASVIWRKFGDSLIYKMSELDEDSVLAGQLQNKYIELPIYNFLKLETGNFDLNEVIIKDSKVILVRTFYYGELALLLDKHKSFGQDTSYPFKLHNQYK